MRNFPVFFLMVVVVISFMSFKRVDKISIWMIGDSTMAYKKSERNPESGWAEAMKDFVKSGVIVHNHAASGRSTRSFAAEKRWSAVADSIKPGDYVVIQFGHNDQKTDSVRYTEPFKSYKEFLKMFIDQTREKGGIPVICSSIVRRHFDGEGKLIDTHGDYIRAAREIAVETNTAYVDMEALTRKMVQKAGPEKSKSLYTFAQPGEFGRKNGVQDSTHLSYVGATEVARLFVDEVYKKKLPLRRYLKK